MTMAERFLVIGSNCFSGATFAAHLLDQGFEVLGISRSPEPPDCFLPYTWGPHDRFRFVQADLNTDLDRIVELVQAWRPPYVANYAAQGMVPQSWSDPAQWFQTNTLAMVRLHERLRGCSFLKKYLQVSTPEVYGNTAGAVREDANYSPSTPYAASKAACDLSLLAFFKGYGFPVVFTRSANVCGPGQQLYRIIPRTILSILLGRRLGLEGGGASRRSFIHMRDVADGQLRALRDGEPGEIFHLATDRVVSIRELVEIICGMLGARVEDYVDAVEGRRGGDGAYLLDCTKARTQLAWAPQRSLEDAICETIAWVQRNLPQLREWPPEYVHKQ
jgi:dTDP-glucose 4,6-dehydratase